MAITVSNPNNITSPIGNALAIFKDSSTNNFFVVDINGKTESLERALGQENLQEVLDIGNSALQDMTVNGKITFGESNTNSGTRSFIAGSSNTISSGNNFVIGNSNTNSGVEGIVIGSSNSLTLNSTTSVLIGKSNNASAESVYLIGNLLDAQDNSNTFFLGNTIDAGANSNSYAFGQNLDQFNSDSFQLHLGEFSLDETRAGYLQKITIGVGTDVLNKENGLVIWKETTSPFSNIFDITGKLSLNNYGSGNITGTATYTLGVTSSGDIIEITNAGGNVTGTGTTQTLPVWSDGSNGALGDSPIKVIPSTTGGVPSYADNLLIGDWNSTPAVTSNRTLQVGNDNIVGNSLGKTARAIVVGETNRITATLTQPLILNSTVIGKSNDLSSSETLVVGTTNTVRGGTGFVAGVDNTTSDRVPRQFVIGRENTVDSIDTIVLGDRNTVTETGNGFGSMMVFGHLNTILGDRVLCLGTSNTANSDNQDAYLIGVANSSTADRTYTLGRQNSITATESFALGQTNTITGTQCVAVGVNNTLAGFDKSYAFGFGNDNVNFKSFAIGEKNDVLNSQRTYLIGRENKPATDNTIILGQFSDPTVFRLNNTNGRSTVAFAVGVNNGIRRTAWEFRGRETSTGNTIAGDSMRIMAWALLYSTSYADDTVASAGGVEVGQLYRTGSTVKIRMT
jgi:hypothetical protein